MTWSPITSAKGKATTASMDTTGADFLVVFIATDGSFTVSDSKSNTWSYATVGSFGRIAYCRPTSVGTGHTFSTPVSYSYVFAAAFSGSATSPFDAESSGGGTNQFAANGVSFSGEPGSVTPAETDELFITGIALGYDAGSAAIDDGFTVLQSQAGVPSNAYGGALAYKIKTDSTAENPTWTASATSQNSEHTLRMAAFKTTGGGGGGGSTNGIAFGSRGGRALNAGKTFVGGIRRAALDRAHQVGDRIAAAVHRERINFGEQLLAGLNT